MYLTGCAPGRADPGSRAFSSRGLPGTGRRVQAPREGAGQRCEFVFQGESPRRDTWPPAVPNRCLGRAAGGNSFPSLSVVLSVGHGSGVTGCVRTGEGTQTACFDAHVTDDGRCGLVPAKLEPQPENDSWGEILILKKR